MSRHASRARCESSLPLTLPSEKPQVRANTERSTKSAAKSSDERNVTKAGRENANLRSGCSRAISFFKARSAPDWTETKMKREGIARRLRNREKWLKIWYRDSKSG